jgi:hypothetical protein
MNRIVIFAIILFGFININAQENSQIAQDVDINLKEPEKNPFTLSAYLEIYYCYDFSKPENHLRPSFFYNFNRTNEVNLNLGYIKINYSKDNVRANFALMAGTYAQYNMSAEQELLQNVYEANAGVKVSKNHNLWVDAGVMPSHIGFESAVGIVNKNLTRSILAENSPYYETGVKIGYTSKSEKWYAAVMYLNGWQRINRIEGNYTPAFGTQLTYTSTSKKSSYNWSTYIGNEQPDSIQKWRYFNNFYGQFTTSEKTNLIIGFDIGAQQASTGSSIYDVWLSPIIIAQYVPISKIQLGARAEYYQDPEGVLIPTTTPNGFRTYGLSLNFDYLPLKNVMFRLEAKALNSKDDIFLDKNGSPTNENQCITTSLAITL